MLKFLFLSTVKWFSQMTIINTFIFILEQSVLDLMIYSLSITFCQTLLGSIIFLKPSRKGALLLQASHETVVLETQLWTMSFDGTVTKPQCSSRRSMKQKRKVIKTATLQLTITAFSLTIPVNLCSCYQRHSA